MSKVTGMNDKPRWKGLSNGMESGQYVEAVEGHAILYGSPEARQVIAFTVRGMDCRTAKRWAKQRCERLGLSRGRVRGAVGSEPFCTNIANQNLYIGLWGSGQHAISYEARPPGPTWCVIRHPWTEY